MNFGASMSNTNNQDHSKPKKRWLKRLLLFFGALVILTILTVLGFIVHAKFAYRDFHDASSRQFEIPDIHSGFTPQGIEYLKDKNQFLISGYGKNHSAKIYSIQSDEDMSEKSSYREISLLDTDGSNFINHAGGICASEQYIFLAGCDGKCYVLSRDNLVDPTANSVQIIGSFDAYNNADFCYIKNNRLYVGEYYAVLKYETDANHRITTPSGDKNNAIITVFELSETDPDTLSSTTNHQKFGVSDTPIEIYSITGAVQGMCITDNEIVLSASALFSSSKLYCYDYQTIHQTENDYFSVNGLDVPLYYLDDKNLNRIIHIPPKAEGIIFHDEKMSIVFESASNKYLLGKFIGGEYIYLFDFSK